MTKGQTSSGVHSYEVVNPEDLQTVIPESYGELKPVVVEKLEQYVRETGDYLTPVQTEGNQNGHAVASDKNIAMEFYVTGDLLSFINTTADILEHKFGKGNIPERSLSALNFSQISQMTNDDWVLLYTKGCAAKYADDLIPHDPENAPVFMQALDVNLPDLGSGWYWVWLRSGPVGHAQNVELFHKVFGDEYGFGGLEYGQAVFNLRTGDGIPYLTVELDIGNSASLNYLECDQYPRVEDWYDDTLHTLIKNLTVRLKLGLDLTSAPADGWTAKGDVRAHFVDGKLHCDDEPAYIDSDKVQDWWNKGLLHREDGPAESFYYLDNKCEEWRFEGKLHRENGPAILYHDKQEYWLNGRCHRLDGPAIDSKACLQWWVEGRLHRIDGPAIEQILVRREWWVDDKRHRVDGPAVDRSEGSPEWWLDDVEYSETEFAAEVKRKKEGASAQVVPIRK